ncbi:MAG: hypothetical protein PHC29_05925 [Candidatus Omnitrophica bacterium]|nr:hypothetical protein [Candidatus Omnitrophota bacterium]
MKIFGLKFSSYFYILFCLSAIYLYFDWVASDQIYSIKLDRFELFNIDESLHYCYAKSALYYPIALINPFAKVGFTSSCFLFLKIFSENILSLRIMNSVYSIGVFILMVKIGSFLKLSKKTVVLSIILTAFFPLFFLGSISVINEAMFSFFLLVAIWSAYKEKLFASALAVSFLPLISQFGFIYLLIWTAWLIKKGKFKPVILIFGPTVLWTITNMLLLGHSLFYTLYYRTLLMPHPPLDSLVTPGEFVNFYFLTFCPLIILFIFLSVFNRKKYLGDGKLWLIQAVLVFQLLQFIFEIFIMPFFYSGMFIYKIRQLIPAVPLLAILTAFILEKTIQAVKKSRLGDYLYILIAAISIVYLPYSIIKLQKFPLIKNEFLSPEQEKSIIEAGVWLKGYCQKHDITSLVGDGEDLPSSVNRRIWMQAPNKIIYYGTKGLKRVPNTALNLLTYKSSPIGALEKCLFLVRNPDKSLVSTEIKLIKDFPSISLYFYAK